MPLRFEHMFPAQMPRTREDYEQSQAAFMATAKSIAAFGGDKGIRLAPRIARGRLQAIFPEEWMHFLQGTGVIRTEAHPEHLGAYYLRFRLAAGRGDDYGFAQYAEFEDAVGRYTQKGI